MIIHVFNPGNFRQIIPNIVCNNKAFFQKYLLDADRWHLRHECRRRLHANNSADFQHRWPNSAWHNCRQSVDWVSIVTAKKNCTRPADVLQSVLCEATSSYKSLK